MSHSNDIPAYEIGFSNPRKTDYCLVIPIINEGERFVKQLARLKKYSQSIDILIADGGSTDTSVTEAVLKSNNVHSLLIKTGPGKLSSQLRMAYSFALGKGYKGIITMDGNGKDGVDAIPLFIDKLDSGYDYVQGSRFISGGKEENTPLLRFIANRYIHAPLLSIAARHFWFTDTTNGFRAYSKRYLEDPRVEPFRSIFSKYELLAYLTVRASQIGYKVTEVPVTRVYPKGEVPTKISAIKGNYDLLRTLFLTVIGYYSSKNT